MSTATIHEQVEVPQPPQHGKPGGFLRHTNIVTGLVGGIALAAVVYFIGSTARTPSSPPPTSRGSSDSWPGSARSRARSAGLSGTT
jgi:hypothetical protein